MMDLDWVGSIGWRDAVLVAAAAIGVYLVLSVMRLFQFGGRHRGDAKPGTRRGVFAAAESRSGSPAPAASEAEFSRELARSNVELELERLRREGVLLREELARLTEEVTRLKAARNVVSPLYDEATALAQQGMPAAGIAGHCGISIGEAELVAALARSGTDFERHQQGEDRDERNTHSGNRPYG